MKITTYASALALVAVGIAFAGPAQARDQIRIVGSSTVYPFTTAVAEQLGKTAGIRVPVVESTGTGGGGSGIGGFMRCSRMLAAVARISSVGGGKASTLFSTASGMVVTMGNARSLVDSSLFVTYEVNATKASPTQSDAT